MVQSLPGDRGMRRLPRPQSSVLASLGFSPARLENTSPLSPNGDRQASKRASVPLPSLFSRACNHNHSFAGPPLHRAESPESSSNGIKTRPIGTPSPNTKSTARGRHSSIVDSIDQHAVRALASGHKNKRPCRTLDTNHGSFKICSFTEFLKRRANWIVRIPIEPVLHDVSAKLQRDVITMR
ncbi:Uncharacterized protein HZ326_30739 [Fusarium oxysporum f. sp. albedinis]|nr:Uncharacterized protein HZ326_30739 [Fusarium oxysporum f. sp. albedinis]